MTNSDKREFENHCLITLKIKLQKIGASNQYNKRGVTEKPYE